MIKLSDFVSLIFYIICFIISSLFYYLYNKNNKKILLFLSLLIPIFIGGFRYGVGTDFKTYIGLYNIYKNSINIINDSKIIELNFILISIISKYLYGEKSLFLIYTILTLFFAYKGINTVEKKYRPLAYFIYLFLYFTSSFNGIRQMLAVNIIFYAVKYINNKNLYKWTAFVIIAGLTHTTAFIMYPLYFILSTDKKIFKLGSVLLMLVVVQNYQYFIGLLANIEEFDKYAKYTTYNSNFSLNNYNFYLSIIVLFYFIINYSKLNSKDKNNYNYIILFTFGCIFNLLGFFSPDIKRISTYFKIFEISLLCQIPFKQITNRDKVLNLTLVIIYSVGSFIIYSYILKHSNIIPYRWW